MSDSLCKQGSIDNHETWLYGINNIPTDWELLPLDNKKRPFDPYLGRLISEWQNGPSWDPDDIITARPAAVGVMLGPISGGLLAVDFDGPGSEEKFIELFGRPSSELPVSLAWTSGREQRRQVAFMVDPDWWDYISGSKKYKNAQGCNVLELRWAGQQSAFAGAHPDTDGYRWIDGCSPAEHPEPAWAPEWLLDPLVHTESELAPFESTSMDAERATRMLRHLDPNDYSDYWSWLKVGMALHSTDSDLLGVWLSWSRQMANFDETECRQKWASFAKGACHNRLTIRSLHHWAKQSGYTEPANSSKSKVPQIIEKGSGGGGNVGKVEWVIEGFLAKGATVLLAAEAGAGKTSLLMHAASAVEQGTLFLDQIPTRKGRVLFIQGDEPQRDSEDKLRIMNLIGVFAIAYPESSLDLDWLAEQAKEYDLMVIDSATSLLTGAGSYHEDAAFSDKLYAIGRIISTNSCSCIITSHLRKTADGLPRKKLTSEDIAGRATIRNALQDYWGLLREHDSGLDPKYFLECFGKRYCRAGERWELQGDAESYWWGLSGVSNGLLPEARRNLEANIVTWFADHPDPLPISRLASEFQKNEEHVRRVCLALFNQGILKRFNLSQGKMGRPSFAYSLA